MPSPAHPGASGVPVETGSTSAHGNDAARNRARCPSREAGGSDSSFSGGRGPELSGAETGMSHPRRNDGDGLLGSGTDALLMWTSQSGACGQAG